ncbi:MAG TPA: hypothetical protein VGL91_21640 [Acidobacteriota bacterium]
MSRPGATGGGAKRLESQRAQSGTATTEGKAVHGHVYDHVHDHSYVYGNERQFRKSRQW